MLSIIPGGFSRPRGCPSNLGESYTNSFLEQTYLLTHWSDRCSRSPHPGSVRCHGLKIQVAGSLGPHPSSVLPHGPCLTLPSTAGPNTAQPHGGHAYNSLHLHHPGPPSSEGSSPWRDLLLPLPQMVLVGVAGYLGALPTSSTPKFHSGFPDLGPVVTSWWPLSVAKIVRCAGQVLPSAMMSRETEVLREEGARGLGWEGETPARRAAVDGRGWKRESPGGFDAGSPRP